MPILVKPLAPSEPVDGIPPMPPIRLTDEPENEEQA